jgi:hypothetical protein
MRILAYTLAIAVGALGCSGSDSPDTSPDAAQPPVDAADPVDGDPSVAPIVATADQWSWVDFPDSRCAGGTPTGIGINPHAGSTDLIIYFQGGGHCATGAGCWGPSPGATFLDGYGAAEFATYGTPDFAILDRDDDANPLRTASMVFVPYCTGDLHAGTRDDDLVVGDTTKHTWFWGARDLDIFLERLVPTFSGVQRVYLIGVSAGGFASFLSFDRVADAFPSARIDIVDDSGPPIVPNGATKNGTLAAWDYVPPSNCQAPCDTYSAIVAAARERQPDSRIGFILYAKDSTLWDGFAFPTIDDYADAIQAFSAGLSDPHEAAFVVTNTEEHVVMNDRTLDAQIVPWLAQLVTDDASWTSTTYAHP